MKLLLRIMLATALVNLTPAVAKAPATVAGIQAILLGGSRTMPRNPNPPALLIAATSSDRATPPMLARTTGYLQSSRSQTRVDR